MTVSDLENSVVLKEKKLLDAINEANIADLKALAVTEHGLISDCIRKKAWILLTSADEDFVDIHPTKEWVDSRQDFNQVHIDVIRSIKRFPPSIKDLSRMQYQNEIIEIILILLEKSRKPDFLCCNGDYVVDDVFFKSGLCYYQGFHDIVLTILLVLGYERTVNLLTSLMKTHFYEFMQQTMEQTSRRQHLVPSLLEKLDPVLFSHMQKANVGVMFCLPWIITWFSHSLEEYSELLLLFDALIASHPLFIYYVTVALIVKHREALLECECEMSSLHQRLSALGCSKSTFNVNELVPVAIKFMKQHPPQSLNKRANALYSESFKPPDGAIKRKSSTKISLLATACNFISNFTTGSSNMKFLIGMCVTVFSSYLFYRFIS